MDLYHPFTGLPAIGVVGGRPVWPVMGAAEPDTGQQQGQQTAGQQQGDQPAGDGQGSQAAGDRPEGVSDEEWAALGDPGKRAIERERRTARELQRTLDARNRELEEARKQPPAAEKPAEQGKPAKAEQPDVGQIVQQAVEAALRPFQQQQDAARAQRIQDRTQSLAATLLHNPADAVSFLDLTSMVTATGDPDEQAIRDGLARLIEERPYLAKTQDGRRAAAGSGQGAGGGGGQTIQQRVQAQLDLMKSTS